MVVYPRGDHSRYPGGILAGVCRGGIVSVLLAQGELGYESNCTHAVSSPSGLCDRDLESRGIRGAGARLAGASRRTGRRLGPRCLLVGTATRADEPAGGTECRRSRRLGVRERVGAPTTGRDVAVGWTASPSTSRRVTSSVLIGPNGAGKTTLVDAVFRFPRQQRGRCVLAEQGGAGRKAFPRASAARHRRTFQAIELYDDLTVYENVVVGLTGGRGRHATDGQQELEEVFQLLGLEEFRDRPAGELPQGRRQLVSIARALVARPAVLLLDEPASGLDTTESMWLGERLRDIRDTRA